jgi:hypothetical protein
MSNNIFKVPTFTYLFLLNKNNSPNFPNLHHLPMSLRENSFSSSFFLLYFCIVEFHIYLQIVFLHCLHSVIISYYLTSTSKRSEGVVFFLSYFCHTTTSPVTVGTELTSYFLTTSYRLPTDFPDFTTSPVTVGTELPSYFLTRVLPTDFLTTSQILLASPNKVL